MNTMTDTYKTPEGFELHKPLVFPEVRSLDELLTIEGPWDFATMNHKNGHPQPATPPDPKRPAPLDVSKIVGRFLSTRYLPGRGNYFVTPTAKLLDRIWQEESEGLDFAFFDRVGFEAIYHVNNDRVLLVASASGILASRYLAYIDPATIPGEVDES